VLLHLSLKFVNPVTSVTQLILILFLIILVVEYLCLFPGEQFVVTGDFSF